MPRANFFLTFTFLTRYFSSLARHHNEHVFLNRIRSKVTFGNKKADGLLCIVVIQNISFEVYLFICYLGQFALKLSLVIGLSQTEHHLVILLNFLVWNILRTIHNTKICTCRTFGIVYRPFERKKYKLMRQGLGPPEFPPFNLKSPLNFIYLEGLFPF